MTAIGPSPLIASDIEALQSGTKWHHRVVVRYAHGDFRLSKMNVFRALWQQFTSWISQDKNTVVLSRVQSAEVVKKIKSWPHSSQFSEAKKLYKDMIHQHQGNWEQFLKKVGKSLPAPDKSQKFQSNDPEVRAGQLFIYTICEHAAKGTERKPKPQVTSEPSRSAQVATVSEQTAPEPLKHKYIRKSVDPEKFDDPALGHTSQDIDDYLFCDACCDFPKLAVEIAHHSDLDMHLICQKINEADRATQPNMQHMSYDDVKKYLPAHKIK